MLITYNNSAVIYDFGVQYFIKGSNNTYVLLIHAFKQSCNYCYPKRMTGLPGGGHPGEYWRPAIVCGVGVFMTRTDPGMKEQKPWGSEWAKSPEAEEILAYRLPVSY